MAKAMLKAGELGLTRAKQFTEEKIGTSEKTLYDAQFETLCIRADKTKALTKTLLKQCEAMVQPNTGSTLAKTGHTMKLLANTEKDFMQKTKSSYIHTLRSFLDNDMKTITKERKALEVKRLDLDASKSKVKKPSTPDKAENELRQAQSDFDRQLEVTKLLLEGVSTAHSNHLAEMISFVEDLSIYHAECQQHLVELQIELKLSLHQGGASPKRSENNCHLF